MPTAEPGFPETGLLRYSVQPDGPREGKRLVRPDVRQAVRGLNIAADDDRIDPILPYLEQLKINFLSLNQFKNPDLSRLPAGISELELNGCDIQDLSGLPEMKLSMLSLYDLPEITSFSGIEKIQFTPMLSKLQVYGCPRLTDWSALEGRTINQVELYGTYTMPDLGKMKFNDLTLDSLPWLEDLSCLNGLPAERYYNFSLLGLDLVTDLSPLTRLKGQNLRVSPQLKEQAESLVEENKFVHCEVVYPDAGWGVWKGNVQLKSLEDLETLPTAALRRVEQLRIAGDRIANWDQYDLWDKWDENGQYYILWDRETEQETRVETGTMTDLSRLSKLTGLVQLEIVEQPLTSLDGIEDMLDLEYIKIAGSQDLADISPLFTLEKIREIHISQCGVTSIQGIQNLPMLKNLDLFSTMVTDISPLAECDLTEAYRGEGLSLTVKGEELADYTPLESVQKYANIALNEGDFYQWIPHLQNAKIDYMYLDQLNRETDLTKLPKQGIRSLRIDSFQQLKSLHGLEELIASGDLEELQILGCPRLTDWSALESGYLPKLWLYGTFDIPDMTRMDIGTLRLEQLSWLKDLGRLETIAQEREINLELVNLEKLKDLNALKKIRGNRLAVSEDLLKQARTAAGRSFRSVEIADADGWGLSNDQFTLISLEELETLPDNVLAQVTNVYLAGDRLIDPDRYRTEYNWDYDPIRMDLVDNENGLRVTLDYSGMTDLSSLAKLTGLVHLEMDMTGITSLAGIENMQDLEVIHIRCAPNLTDVSALWGLKNLRWIELNQTGVTSIDGIQNLKMLQSIQLYGQGLKDISPLKECNFEFAYQGMGLEHFFLSIDEEADLAPLENLKRFSDLDLEGDMCARMLPYLRNAEVSNLTIRNTDAEISLADLPKVTGFLSLHNLPGLKDLTGLSGTAPKNGVQLDNLQNLTSLNGIRGWLGADGIATLDIGSCPRLTDWSALNEAKPLKLRIYGDLVSVPENLRELAEPVNEEIDPGEWWEQNVSVEITSLDELDTLPDSLLESVTNLSMVGDQRAEWNLYEVRRDRDENGRPEARKYVYKTGEEVPIPLGTLTDMNRLSRLKNLETLELFCQPLTSLAGIENLPKLREVELKIMPNLTDTSALASLPQLERVWLEYVPANSLEWVRNLTNLRSIWMTNIYPQIQDLSPLADCDFSKAYENGGVSLKLDYDQNTVDYTPLAAIREYSEIDAGNSEVGKILPLLEGKTVHWLSLNHPDEPVDLSKFPAVSDRLELHQFMDLTDLTGLKAPGPHTLMLDNLPDLTSLNGIRELIGEGGIREIRIGKCLKLTDWSAVEGTDLEKIVVHDDLVTVPESLRDKVEQTDGNGEYWSGELMVTLHSLEDLRNLPEKAKGSIKDLLIIGDELYDSSVYEPYDERDEKLKKQVPRLRNQQTGEVFPVETGTMTDLSILKGFTGLEILTVTGQPLESLAGIEDCKNLNNLTITCCDLEDISPLSGLPELEWVTLRYTKIHSIEALAGHNRLHGIWLDNNPALTDLSPLNECDFEYASEHGGLIFQYDNEKVKDLSFLSKVRYFCDLNLSGINASVWVEAAAQPRIGRLVAFGFPNQKVFEAFIEAHQDIETLWIPWNTKVTDLSMLTELPNLKTVDISNTMKKAANSLKGKKYSFELIIE